MGVEVVTVCIYVHGAAAAVAVMVVRGSVHGDADVLGRSKVCECEANVSKSEWWRKRL